MLPEARFPARGRMHGIAGDDFHSLTYVHLVRIIVQGYSSTCHLVADVSMTIFTTVSTSLLPASKVKLDDNKVKHCCKKWKVNTDTYNKLKLLKIIQNLSM